MGWRYAGNTRQAVRCARRSPRGSFLALCCSHRPDPSPHSLLQLAQLGEVDAALRSEYALRRRMLIERVKVTLQSFMWSPRLEAKVGSVTDLYSVVLSGSAPVALSGGRLPCMPCMRAPAWKPTGE